MVVIHVKSESDEQQQFLFECPSTSTVDHISAAISEISTLQSTIQNLSLSLRHNLLTNHDFTESYPDVALALDRALSEAETYASKDQVTYKRALLPRILREHILTIKKKLRTAQPMNLPDSMLRLFSGDVPHEDIQLLWAGKTLLGEKILSEYIGENEKTKIVINFKSAPLGSQHHMMSS